MRWVINAALRPLYPRERPGLHCIGGWVGLGAGLDGCGKSPPPGFNPRTVQPVAIYIYISKRVVQQHKGTDLRGRLENQPTWNVIVMVIGPCIIVIAAESKNQLDCTSYRLNMFQELLCPSSGANLQPTANQERHDKYGKHHSRELLMMGRVMLETC